MKLVQIVNNKVAWIVPQHLINSIIEDNTYPGCKFITAPDYVTKGWGYKEYNENGDILSSDEDRFIKPIPEDGYFYNDYTGNIEPIELYAEYLKKARDDKQEINKKLFADFLASHPLQWTDGKFYGVTLEDQSEISLNLAQYDMQVKVGIERPVLEWHATKERCVPWTVENLTALAIDISQYIYPVFIKMNDYKNMIYTCQTKEEVDSIELNY